MGSAAALVPPTGPPLFASQKLQRQLEGVPEKENLLQHDPSRSRNRHDFQGVVDGRPEVWTSKQDGTWKDERHSVEGKVVPRLPRRQVRERSRIQLADLLTVYAD